MSRLYKPAPPIRVRTERDVPVVVEWRGGAYAVDCFNHWRIQLGWWQPREVIRDYYALISDHLICEVYQDLLNGRWYMHRIYD
jgi:hypothetical protein